MNSLEKLSEAIIVLKQDIADYNNTFEETNFMTPKNLRQQAILQFNLKILEDTIDAYDEDFDEEMDEEDLARMDAIFAEEMNLANTILGLPLEAYEFDDSDSFDDALDFYDFEDEENLQSSKPVTPESFQEILSAIQEIKESNSNGEESKPKFIIMDDIFGNKRVTKIEALINFPNWIQEPESINPDFVKGWDRLAQKIRNILKTKESNPNE